MSSILKALRRLEEERARKSSVAPEIAASLLRDGRRRRATAPWIWPVVIAAVAAMVAALLWSWRPGPVASQIVPPVASPASRPSTATAGQGGAVIIEEVMDQRRPVLPAAPSPVPAPALLPAKVNSLAPRVEAGVQASPELIKPAAIFLEERRNPVVSAIAWQDDSSARMAVVDGLPVMTGEFVGTAKVQEILQDRILFEEAGKLFTVFVDPQ